MHSGSHVQETMSFSHFWYKMDRKKSYTPERAIHRQQMKDFLILGRRKKIEQRQQKGSKTATSIERGLQDIRKSRIWMQQLNKARAKERDVSELLVAAARMRSLTQERHAGYRLWRGWQPSLPELKHQHTVLWTLHRAAVIWEGRSNPSAWGYQHLLLDSTFHFLHNCKNFTKALLAFKEYVPVCSS